MFFETTNESRKFNLLLKKDPLSLTSWISTGEEIFIQEAIKNWKMKKELKKNEHEKIRKQTILMDKVTYCSIFVTPLSHQK